MTNKKITNKVPPPQLKKINLEIVTNVKRTCYIRIVLKQYFFYDGRFIIYAISLLLIQFEKNTLRLRIKIW